MEEEQERHSHLFSQFAYGNGELKKKNKVNDSQGDGDVCLLSIHSEKKGNAQSNFPVIRLQSQKNSRVISPFFQKNKTLECNSSEIISPYFQKAVKGEDKRDSEVPLESESRVISPYFQKKKRKVPDSVPCTGSDSNSQRLISPCFQRAVKQHERYSDELCNFPNEIDRKKKKKKKKKKRKKKGNDTFESFKEEEEEEKKINVQDKKMGTELSVLNSNSSSHKVSPFFQEAVNEEKEMNLEAQVESKLTVVSPYFEKKKNLVSDSVSNSTSDFSSQHLPSPCFPKARKQEERSSSEHCNYPHRLKRRKIKKRMKKGSDTVGSCKKREMKINGQNFRVEDQKMNVQQSIFCSNSNSQRRVFPYFEKVVKKTKGNSEEVTKKGHENEETFKKEKEEEERKMNAKNITMEDEKMKLPKKKTRAPPVRVVSPYFPINEEDAQKPVRPMYFNKLNVAYKRKTPNNNWKPPPSPFHLLQEEHCHDPWRVMVICMLLNCTTGLQAKRVISDLFTLCPDAKTAIDVPTKMIEKVIETLGLQKKRAAMIQRLSQEYLDDSWTHVTQLHGIGKYAADAYAIFCSGDWGLVVPNDHMLAKYWKYLYSYYSLQAGLANNNENNIRKEKEVMTKM